MHCSLALCLRFQFQTKTLKLLNYKGPCVDCITAVVFPEQQLRSERLIDKGEKDMKGRPFNYPEPHIFPDPAERERLNAPQSCPLKQSDLALETVHLSVLGNHSCLLKHRQT